MNVQPLYKQKLFWPQPPKRKVGLFTDLRLFIDALEIGEKQGEFTKPQLTEGLSNRVKGLMFIKKLSRRVIDDLIRELINFDWLEKQTKHGAPGFTLTKKGKTLWLLYESDRNAFTQQLIIEMHQLYIIPGWFVNRLWELNPSGQGQIVIPAPLPNWHPKARKWENKEWDNELAEQAGASIRLINKTCTGAFPIDETTWLTEVKNKWTRLSQVQPRTTAKPKKKDKKEKGKMETYAPRLRLFNAMIEAAVNLLFGNKNPITSQVDFDSEKQPLSFRIYIAWCPRLAELGLIHYTDSHPQIPGRLIFPVSVFKSNTNSNSFVLLENITNLIGEKLFLHHPPINEASINNFLDILYRQHQHFYTLVKSLYVSLMDVRDEVCQQLRISAELFDLFLKSSVLGLKSDRPHHQLYTISLESDIREDQGGGYQKLRRPVILDGKPYSLIAMTKTERIEKHN